MLSYFSFQAIIELPLTIAFFANGYVLFPNYYFCKFWLAFEYSLNVSTLFLNVQLAFERYLLIFHHNFLYRWVISLDWMCLLKIVCRHKIIFHFVPMVAVILVAFIYSCGTVLFYPCEENFDYSLQLCGGACYQFQPWMGTFDNVFSVYAPIISITLFTGALVIRVLHQKRKMQQRDLWKKNIRMLTQLLSIVVLHFIAWMPTCIILTISAMATTNSELLPITQYIWVSISCLYIGVLGSPLTSLFALPEIYEKACRVMRRLLRRAQHGRVHALTTNTRQALATNTKWFIYWNNCYRI